METAILYGYTDSVYKMLVYSVIDLHCTIEKSQKTCHTFLAREGGTKTGWYKTMGRAKEQHKLLKLLLLITDCSLFLLYLSIFSDGRKISTMKALNTFTGAYLLEINTV